MKLIKINFKNPSRQVARQAAKTIKEGGIVVMPTDTVYAIFADALNQKTVEKVLRLKKRRKDKGFDLTMYPVKKIFKYVESNDLVPEILKKISDQPLSFALPKKKTLPDFLNPDYKTSAFHFFFSELDKEVFKYLNTPLIGTSANISKLPDTKSIEEVIKYFKHTFDSVIQPDLILDAGELSKKKPSAIIELINQEIKVIREGDMLKKELKKRILKVKKSYENIRN